MKKPKIKLDKDQLLEFLTTHIEKGVFGLFVLGFIMFCLGAMKHKPYDKVPQQFMDAAQKVDAKVTASTFDPATDVPPMEPLPVARDVPQKVWVTHDEWSRPPFDMKKRRPEPKFLALQDVRVATGYGAVYVHSLGNEDKAAPAPGKAAPAPKAAAPEPAKGGGGLRERALNMAGGKAGAAPAGAVDRPNPNAAVKGKQWAVITGLVPIEAQAKDYRAAFRDARKTDPALDYPRYHSFEVERAEVPVGTAPDADLKWTLLDRKRAEDEEATFSERAADVIDHVFADPVLTRPLFKISGKEHGRSAGHPKIPTGSQAPGTVAPAAPAGGGLRARAMAQAGNAAMANANPSQAKAVEYQLFRCFDFSVQPGKTYRYRVRLVLNNPNYGLGAQYLANAQLAKGQTRQSPWSEASAEVTVPLGFSMLAGGIKPNKQINESKLEVILKMWDSNEAVDASRIVELFRGQVANFPAEDAFVERGDGTAEPKRLSFHTDMMVVDMTGGDTMAMPGGGLRPRAPSQVLVMEPNGKLIVKSELADAEIYESTKQRLKKAQEAAKPPVAADEEEDRPKRRRTEQGGGLSKLNAGADAGKAGKQPRGN
ncbi:MAG TPA: hypothetical protein VHD36_13810 [Pirellulales bacterium]|nr:hypothetical protein [Pirellulales bacterium]